MQPQQPQQPNNFDFIVNPGTPQKKSPVGGNSMASRILVVVGGLFVLAIIAAILVNFLGSAGKTFDKNAMLAVAQDQTELQRLATLGNESSVSQSNKNFSATAELGLKSDQAAFLDFLAKSGYKVDPKQLPLKQDAAATTQLEDASSASNFDSTYKTIMKRALQTYQTDLTQAYNSADGDAKGVLNANFESAKLLLSQLDAGN